MDQKTYNKTVLKYLEMDGYKVLPGQMTDNIVRLEKHDVRFIVLTVAVEKTGIRIPDADAEDMADVLKQKNVRGEEQILITNGCISADLKQKMQNQRIFVMDASHQQFPWNE